MRLTSNRGFDQNAEVMWLAPLGKPLVVLGVMQPAWLDNSSLVVAVNSQRDERNPLRKSR